MYFKPLYNILISQVYILCLKFVIEGILLEILFKDCKYWKMRHCLFSFVFEHCIYFLHFVR